MKTIPLWPEEAKLNATRVPTLDIYDPFGTAFSDAAVLILPGGGYGHLSAQEGEGFAGMFQLWGFKSFVCQYRLGSEGHRHPSLWEDAARALRYIRANATELGVNPQKIVVIGSSAGGHLAATLLTKWDAGDAAHADPVERVSSRPDLGILCYPVITMGEHTHQGSKKNLLGEDVSAALADELSAELQVNAETPPCFIWHTYEDPSVPVENALLFAQSLRKAGVPFELHIYQDGAHGLGMKNGIPWPEDCWRWLKKRL